MEIDFVFKKGAKDITGKVFGNLTVIKPMFLKNESIHWECKCSCGNTKIVNGSSLRRKKRPTISCGCAQKEFQKSRKGIPGKRFLTYEESLRRNVLHAIRTSAKERNIDFNLDIDQVASLVFRNCFYCNSAPSNTIKSNRIGVNADLKYSGLDRIDSVRSYSIDNVVPCCRRCNIAKHTMTQKEFYQWLCDVLRNLTATCKILGFAESDIDFSGIWD